MPFIGVCDSHALVETMEEVDYVKTNQKKNQSKV